MTTDPLSFVEALGAWGPDAQAGDPRPGVHDLDVRSVTVDGLDCVGRQSFAEPASLEWEIALLGYLGEQGLTVPLPLPTRDGLLHFRGLVVTRKVAGGHPESSGDWDTVFASLSRIHVLTADYPERPGQADTAAPRARRSVVVGRTRRRDITMSQGGPVFVDWSHCRVGDNSVDFVDEAELAARAAR